MIRVECAACGATFQAKDELAGRRGKCPQCKAAITVPQAGSAASPAPAAAPARKAPGAGSSSTRAPKGGARRRHASRSRKGGMGPVVVVVVVAVLIAGGAFMLSGDSVGVLELQQAIEAKTVAQFDKAIALLESIPETSNVYDTAQTELIDVRERKHADDARRLELKAGGLYDNIKSVEKNYVLGPGPSGPNYATNTRYLLKRAAEFVQKYPTDSRAKEIELFAFKYAKVASLSTPPTEADVDAELRFRFLAHDYHSAVSAIDEFAGGEGADPDAVRRLRDKVQTSALDYWKTLKAVLDSTGALTEGDENWQQVANICLRYLTSIENVPGVTPAVDAKALYARAQEG